MCVCVCVCVCVVCVCVLCVCVCACVYVVCISTCSVPYFKVNFLTIHCHNLLFLSNESGDPILKLIVDISHEKTGLPHS